MMILELPLKVKLTKVGIRADNNSAHSESR
jgi:hypothetical protein